MPDAATIQKTPLLPPEQDYQALRKAGIELIQQLGSNLWTDYNIHDPGITLLELLCYAVTDIGYREGFSIPDLLTDSHGKLPADEQCFFTPRKVLTQNAWTPNDWRKMLIDIPGVRNAWHLCSTCGCSAPLYANCATSTLQYAPTEHPIRLRGFNNVLLELEVDATGGDLNSGKIFQSLGLLSAGRFSKATVECRFPPWHKLENSASWLKQILQPHSSIEPGGIKLLSLSGNTQQSVDIPNEALYRALRAPLFANIEISYRSTPASAIKKILLEDVPVKVWYRSDADRKAITVASLRQLIEDGSISGIVQRYITQLNRAAEVLKRVKQTVHQHRNLAEDYCDISTIPVCDVAICADIEMTATADIEAVMGKAYWLIEQYCNLTVPFYSLRQLLDKAVPVEEIFNGPALQHGFLLNQDLDKSAIKSSLHTSDIINILMDIEGIIAVKNIALARYNAQGILVESQPWTLQIPDGQQPRLYVHASKVLVYKNDLPFLPNADELNDTLQMLKGQYQQQKMLQSENDLTVPAGKYVNTGEQWPLQNMLPDTYGTGVNGLPEIATKERKAQAKQLKAYLLVFEQLLQVYILQLKHFSQLFNTDSSIAQTWFAQLFTDAQLAEASALYDDGFSEPELMELLETHPQFVTRRNQFLDHLLARFAENFSDYALHVYALYGNEVKAGEVMIDNKIRMLQQFPEISSNRARAFNYTDATAICQANNEFGLVQRIKQLLGFNGWQSLIMLETNWSEADKWWGRWQLTNPEENILLQGPMVKNQPTEASLRTCLLNQSNAALLALQAPASLAIVAAGSSFVVQLIKDSNVLAATTTTATLLESETAKAAIEILLSQVLDAQKVLVIEHLLLRPRFWPSKNIPTGDPLLSICIGPNCQLCGDEDPYSFRITVVLSGEQTSGLANQGIAFRRYAENAIRMETPAHIGVKICWVSNRQLATFQRIYCQWLQALANDETPPAVLSNKLHRLLCIFNKLKSVYPPASLHDCTDGDDENRVYLNNTVI